MSRRLFTIFFVFLLNSGALAQSYGLIFNSHESLPEKRTALELAPGDSLCFRHAVKLQFEMNLIADYHIYFGYILRIINQDENIDLIYDQKSFLFRLITGQNFSGVSFYIDTPRVFNEWNKITLLLDPQNHQISLSVNDKRIGSSPVSLRGNCYKFLWGANDYGHYQTRDIPPLRLREIRLFDDNTLKYHWSLNEIAGEMSLDEISHEKAIVKNGVWIKPKHQNWAQLSSFKLNGNAVVAFDKKAERLFIAGADSMLIYDVKNVQNPWTRLAVSYENILTGSQAVYDTLTGKMYDVFIDQHKVASCRPGDSHWDVPFDSALTEYWHANKFISTFDTSLYIIAGYGQLKYKNIVQRCHLPSKRWETLHTSGDALPPRYLSALGINASGDTAYIMGGYGSPTGDQMLDPRNYFDLFAFDIKKRTFKKLFDLDSVHSKFTFANSLVIDSKAQQYYGLIFPNDSFNSNLQLIRGSLKKPAFYLLGNSIPYSFYDLQSFVDLYYAPGAGKLIAVTLFYSKLEAPEKSTEVKIYSLDFPPEYPLPEIKNRDGNLFRYIIPLFLLALVTAGLVLFRKKKKLQTTSAGTPSEPAVSLHQYHPSPEMIGATIDEEEKISSRILLFGQFQVFDKTGADITELFTPLIKELFLLILIYTYKTGRGVSSEELNEILWNDKPAKDAKNNRSVNMVKLKNILERVGSCKLVKKSGFWQFEIENHSIYVDYEKYTSLLREKAESDVEHVRRLLAITGKGSFLFQTEYDWLDDIKSDISNSVIQMGLRFLKRHNGSIDNPEFTIEITNCIFHFDRLNEDALEYQCRSLIQLKRHALANKTYSRFVKDYLDMYGEEFSRSFNQVIKNGPASPQQV